MRFSHHFCAFDKVFSAEQCQQIIKIGKSSLEQAGLLEPSLFAGHRNSRVAWIDEPWIFDRLSELVHYANQHTSWNFQIDLLESLQFTEYTAGQFYHWHSDGASDQPYIAKETQHRPEFRGKIRKLSVTLSLNDDYDGGDFEILGPVDLSQDPPQGSTMSPPVKKMGSAVVFPSYLPHRITPVTRGTRHSIVMWCLGKPFT